MEGLAWRGMEMAFYTLVGFIVTVVQSNISSSNE